VSPACTPVSSPPPPWIGLSAMPAYAWIGLVAGVALCVWYLRRDWSRMLPGHGRWRVMSLCILTFVNWFGGTFLLVTGQAELRSGYSIEA
jgi:hypothetical protein